jgi:SPP1 family predicted phage head-tail adaptor
VKAGTLRQRIEFQEDQGTTQDAYGAVTADWNTVARRWAEVVPLSGRELEVARAQAPTADHRVTLRHWPDLKPHHRVKFGDKYFAINSVLNTDQRDRELVLLCTEAVQPDTET